MSANHRRLAATLLLVVVIPAAALAQQQVGVNSAIRNQVQMKTARDAAPRPAVIREQVHIGDAVQTGAASQLQVLLLDKSVFTVGPNARLTIDKFVYDPAKSSSEVAASVARGAFRFVSGGPAGPGGRTISTPAGSIGIRGTMVEGAVGPDALSVLAKSPGAPHCSGDPERAVLVVLRGPGSHTTGFDKPGALDVTIGGAKVTLATPGQAVLLCGGPASPFTLSDAALGALSDLLRPGGGGDNGSEIGSIGLASNSIPDTVDPTRFPPAPSEIDQVFVGFPRRPPPKPPCDPLVKVCP